MTRTRRTVCGQEDGNNEAVDADHTRHNDGDNRLHDELRAIDGDGGDAEAGLGRAVRGANACTRQRPPQVPGQGDALAKTRAVAAPMKPKKAAAGSVGTSAIVCRVKENWLILTARAPRPALRTSRSTFLKQGRSRAWKSRAKLQRKVQ